MHMSVEIALAAVSERLHARHSELLATATSRILSEMPVYEDLVPEDDLLGSGGAILQMVIGVVHGQSPSANGGSIEAGRRRMLQGVALEDVLRAIRLDFTVLWQALVAEASIEHDPVEVVSLGALRLWSALDQAMIEITEGYRQEEAIQDRASVRQRHQAMSQLLDAGDTSERSIRLVEKAVGFASDERLLLVVGRVEDHVAQQTETQWRTVGAPAYVEVHGTETVGVTRWSAVARQVINTTMAEEKVAVVARRVDGLAALPAAVEVCRSAVRGSVGRRSGVHELRELLVEAIVGEAPHVARYLHQEVFSFAEGGGSRDAHRILQTLQGWIDWGGSTSEVASRLYLHRNTVTNHLRRVEERTGLSLDHPSDVAMLVLALAAHGKDANGAEDVRPLQR
jgi:hypothetical protein